MSISFAHVLLAHVVGDFFLQNNQMATNKNKTGWKAFVWCTIHVLVYSSCITVFFGNYSLIFFLGVFIPHWMVDRWSLGYYWMKVTGSAPMIGSDNPTDAAFGAIIYLVMDQTIHFVSLYVLLSVF